MTKTKANNFRWKQGVSNVKASAFMKKSMYDANEVVRLMIDFAQSKVKNLKKKNKMNQTADNRKYWHEISQDELQKLLDENVTIRYINQHYKQPNWCNYPNGLTFTLGCYSLCDLSKDGLRTKINTDFCNSCHFFNNKKNQ